MMVTLTLLFIVLESLPVEAWGVGSRRKEKEPDYKRKR